MDTNLSAFGDAFNFAGVDLLASDESSVVDLIATLSRSGESAGEAVGHHVHLANAFTLVCAARDAGVRGSLCGRAVNLVDGTPLILAARYLGRVDSRFSATRGPRVFSVGLESASCDGLGHFLLGGSPDVLDAIHRRLAEQGSQGVWGSWSPPFSATWTDEIHEEALARILQSGARIVWVGLGTPKQDLVAARIAADSALVAIAVGAAFDFYAGTITEAPSWLQKSGFEWLYRLAKEPRRLAGRYTLGNLQFVRMVLREFVTSR